jgi:DNA-binding winged helix-turn-helix (wHTH) protein
MFEQIIVDAGARTITFRGRTCRLGNTLVFRLMERLARRPNHFVTFDRLIRDVWDQQARSDEAIRSVMKELRRRLRKSRMTKLASAIRGQKKAYAIIFKT